MSAINLENLEKTYNNGLKVVKGIDLNIEYNDFFGLLGPNGAGKTTIINIITSLVKKTNGKVTICGYNLDTHSDQVKSLLGVVPQEVNLAMFEKSIDILINQAGFYGIPRAIASDRAEKYLTLLNLWDKRNEIPKNLSGGMKRRLMIARALIHDPQILILDEPTAGVDIEIRRSMWKFLLDINKSKTILLTTHYLEEIEYLCNKMAILNKGVIIEQGSIKEILNKLDEESFIVYLDKAINITDFQHEKFLKIIDSHTIELTTNKEYSLGAILNILVQKNIVIKTMKNSLNRLEKFFLQVTKN